MTTHFEELGEERLRAVIDVFVERVFSDAMIGFLFRGVDRARLVELEFQFARAHLGGGGAYEGRPVAVAHAPHPIRGGHFNRRLRILEKVLRDMDVPAHVASAWLAHNESLRSTITRDRSSECQLPEDVPRQHARSEPGTKERIP